MDLIQAKKIVAVDMLNNQITEVEKTNEERTKKYIKWTKLIEQTIQVVSKCKTAEEVDNTFTEYYKKIDEL